MSRFIKLGFLISILLNVALASIALHLLGDSIDYTYTKPAYDQMKRSFEDLAILFPKNMTRQQIEKTWPNKIETYPPHPNKDTLAIGVKTGEVIFYFYDNNTIQAIRSSYTPWLNTYPDTNNSQP